jgi:hypothetical protein
MEIYSRERDFMLNRLVGVDPGSEEAETSVDGGEGNVAARATPGGGTDNGVAADQGSAGITIAGSDSAAVDADVSVVDLSR